MPKRGPVEAAVWRNLTVEQRKSGLGTAALRGAQMLDDPLISPRDFATLLAQLRATVIEIRRASPPKQQEDSLAQRRARRAASRGAAG